MPCCCQSFIAEQVTAQELLSLDYRVSQRRSFWAKQNNGAEVDFTFTHASGLYPIEVKSGTNSHLRSLQVFTETSNLDTAIRIWSNPFSIDKVKTPGGKLFSLVNLPFYHIGNLPRILDSLRKKEE